MIDIYVFLWIVIKGNACQLNLSPEMFIFKALYSEIKAWPKACGYCRLDSSCDYGIKYCRGLDGHNKSWVAHMKSHYTRWMFLDVGTIKVILPVRDRSFQKSEEESLYSHWSEFRNLNIEWHSQSYGSETGITNAHSTAELERRQETIMRMHGKGCGVAMRIMGRRGIDFLLPRPQSGYDV